MELEYTGAIAAASRSTTAQVSRTARVGENLASYTTIVGITVAIGLIAIVMGRYTAFFNGDGDIKYLAALSLTHHWWSAAIAYPFAALDPNGQFVLPMTTLVQGHDYAGYSLPFEYLTAISISVFGKAGILLPTLTGTLAILLVELRMCAILGIDRRRPLLLLASVVSTPVIFYALVFSEHTWAVAFFLGGLVVILPARSHAECFRRVLLTGIAAGTLFVLATLMRRELVIACMAAIAVTAIISRERSTAIRCAVALLLVCTIIGSIFVVDPQPLALGITHAHAGRAGIAPGQSSSYLRRIQWLTAGDWASVLLVVTTVILMVARRVKPVFLAPIFALSSVLMATAYAVFMLGHTGDANDNPLSFCPLALWGLWSILCIPKGESNSKSRQVQRILVGVAIIGSCLTVLASYDFGGAWGTRYILFVYPVLILLAFVARQDLLSLSASSVSKRVVEYSFVCIFALSVLTQAIGFMAIPLEKDFVASAMTKIGNVNAPYIVSDDPNVSILVPLAGTRTILYASNRKSLSNLMSLLASKGVSRVVVTCGPRLKQQFQMSCPWNGFTGWKHGWIHHGPLLSFGLYTHSPEATNH